MSASAAPVAAKRGTTARPHVVALLVVHNRLNFTRRCVEALRASTGIGGLDLVVVEDGSTDGTGDWLDALDPAVHRVTGHGDLWFGGGMDAGLKEVRARFAEADYLLTLNNDTFIYPDTINRLVAFAGDNHSVAGAFRIIDRNLEGSAGFQWHPWRGLEDIVIREAWQRAQVDTAVPCDAVATTLALHPMRFVRDHRPVDPSRHPHHRYDAVFSARLRAAGARFSTTAAIVADHVYGEVRLRPSLRNGTWGEIWRALWQDRRSVSHLPETLAMLWETAPGRLQAIPVIGRYCGRLAGSLLLRWWRGARPKA